MCRKRIICKNTQGFVFVFLLVSIIVNSIILGKIDTENGQDNLMWENCIYRMVLYSVMNTLLYFFWIEWECIGEAITYIGIAAFIVLIVMDIIGWFHLEKFWLNDDDDEMILTILFIIYSFIDILFLITSILGMCGSSIKVVPTPARTQTQTQEIELPKIKITTQQ